MFVIHISISEIVFVMEKSKRIRKVPVRSHMSDQELAELIRRDRQERPAEFEETSSGVSNSIRFSKIPAVTEVIAKWL